MGLDTLPIYFLAFSIRHRLSRSKEFRQSCILFGIVPLRCFVYPTYQVALFSTLFF